MTEPGSELSDLGRGPIATSRALELVDRIGARRESSVFALVGEWGSGKTWLLDALLQEVESNAEWAPTRCTILHFNPWYFADEQALFTGFATLLVQQTLRKHRGRAKLAKLLKTVGPSAKYGGIDLSGIVKQAGDALGSTTPSQIRKRVADGLTETGRQLLIVMDDLDRLNPDELLILFKLVRLVGDIPGLHYVLAYDEDTLHHLLKQTAIAAGSAERARRYLEKIVERRWEVPPLTESQLEILLFSRLQLKEGNPSDPGIGYRLEGLVGRAITTPRAAERYVDLANAVPPTLRAELHQGDLYLSLFLRVAAPGLWSAIIENRELLTGRGTYLVDDERKTRAEALLERLTATVSNLPFGTDLLDLVVSTFPAFETALDPRNLRNADAPRIGHADFLEHYLWLDLPPGAVSELTVASALRRLPDPQAEQELRDLLAAAPRLLLESLWRHGTDEDIDKVQVVRMLERLYRTHGIDGTIGVLSTVDRRIFSIANDMLRQMTAAELELVAPDEESLVHRELLTELVARLQVRTEVGAEDLSAFAKRMAEPLATSIATRLESAPSPGFTESPTRRDFIHIFALDRERARSLVERHLDSGSWQADDVLSIYITTMIESPEYRWHLNLQRLREDLGSSLAEKVETAVASQTTSAGDILMEIPAGSQVLTAKQGRSLARYLLAQVGGIRDDD